MREHRQEENATEGQPGTDTKRGSEKNQTHHGSKHDRDGESTDTMTTRQKDSQAQTQREDLQNPEPSWEQT